MRTPEKEGKLLLVCGSFPPDQSATSHLLKKLLPHFRTAGLQVDALTFKKNFCEGWREEAEGGVIYKANCVQFAPKPIKCFQDFFYLAKRKLLSKLRRRKPGATVPVFRETTVKALLSAMNKMDMEQYDRILAVCAYFDAAEALMRYQKAHPLPGRIALYQVDPLAESRIYRTPENAEALQEYEKALFSAMDAVFTTPVIYGEKKALSWDLSQVFPLEFPMETAVPSASPDGEEIKCVFSGLLYGEIRDASATLRLFSQFKDPRIHLYIVGKGQEELLQEYAKGALQGRLHFLGEKPSEECDRILGEANVLVNIGNRVGNQVPSKLFHYISFGKPILNVTAVPDCPTLPYLARHPLAYSLSEEESQQPATVSALEEWLVENSQKQESPESIRQIFRECTPEFIVEEILFHLSDKP